VSKAFLAISGKVFLSTCGKINFFPPPGKNPSDALDIFTTKIDAWSKVQTRGDGRCRPFVTLRKEVQEASINESELMFSGLQNLQSSSLT